ncbi:MAG: serine/threonine protein kinase [Anaerolineae bacterium]|nr:serine/threonine protein kinase [Anaerolineae bacterium]
MTWRSGEQIGAYRLENQLGQGGMATVYKAYHTQLNRPVAIKVMHQNLLDDATFTARFQREAQIVASLSHPHIVPVYDYDQHEGLPFLVMKYVPGVTLKKRLIKKPPTLAEVLDVVKAVGGALDYAHSQDVLHRDIKPSNIVLDQDEVPYLTDFGLARLVTSGESTMSADMLLGTPHYISPEQARGRKDLDGRTDIYSLGIVLYELLVGNVPYTGDTPYSIIHDHIYTPLPRPSKVNPELPTTVEDVLYRALAKQPEERYPTAGAMVDDLQQAVAESRLAGLNADRSIIAAQSLAQMRATTEQDFSQPPTTILPPPAQLRDAAIPAAVIPTTSLNKRKWHENERIWPVSGCAVFLLLAFVFIAILLSMSSAFLELRQLASQTDPGNSIVDRYPIPFSVVGVDLSNQDYPLFIIPRLNLDRAQQFLTDFPDEELSYLLVAQSLWTTNDTRARSVVLDGYPYAAEKTRYLATAAFIANEANDKEAAILLGIFAWQESTTELTDAEYEAFRPFIGNFIYDGTGSLGLLNYRNLVDTLANSEDFQALGISTASTNNPAAFAIIRNYIERGRTETRFEVVGTAIETFTDNNLTRMSHDPHFDAEGLLLRGEYALLQSDPAAAERAWNGILEMDHVPAWIERRADELLNQLQAGEN